MIAFDTETTGLLKPELTELHLQPFITEIYLCRFNWKGEISEEFESYVKPPVPIPEKITEITGITNEMVADAPRFVEIFDDIYDFVSGDDEIYAHNCSFDIGVLVMEMRRYDLEYRFCWPRNQICTVEASMPIRNKRINLRDLYEMATGKKLFNAHRAKDDTKGLVEVIVWMKKEGLFA